MINRIQIRHINVTVTSTSSYVISTFTYLFNGTGKTKPSWYGPYTFSYPKAIISNFKQLAANSTYCKSKTTTNKNGTGFYARIFDNSPSTDAVAIDFYLAKNNNRTGGFAYAIANSSGVTQGKSSTIVAGHQYKTL